MARFCPFCGIPESQRQFIGESCLECSMKRIPPLPNLRISLCSKCGELIDKGRKKKGVSIEEELIRLLKLKGKNAVYRPDKFEVEYDSAGGRVSQTVLVIASKTQCTVCSRASSQYFEAIIQLRGERKRVEKMADRLCEQLNKKTFIPKIDELHEGLDLYCGSRNEAIAALNVFSLGYIRTEKLSGQKDGKRLYRTTLLVRL
jgi:NMD protein affecting ribosome stability and mRNA decay